MKKLLYLFVALDIVTLLVATGPTQPQSPQPAKLQSYDIVAPPACMKMLQERLPTVRGNVVQMDAFVDLKRRLTACGGSLEETR